MNDLILYTSEDGQAQVQLRADRGTVWLTQLEMAKLFNACRQNISPHLNNLFEDRESHGDSVVKETLTTQNRVGPAVSDHFRGITKMVVHGKGGQCEVNDEATQ